MLLSGWTRAKGGFFPDLQLPQLMRKARFTIDDLLEFGCLSPTDALMLKNRDFTDFEELKPGRCTSDYALNFLASREGDLGYIDRPMSVHRVHSAGRWGSKNSREQGEWSLASLVDISRELGLRGRVACRRGIARKQMNVSDIVRRNGEWGSALRFFFKALITAPWPLRFRILGVNFMRMLGRRGTSPNWTLA